MRKFFSKYIYPDNLLLKFKLYGTVNFIRFSVIEIYRIFLRLFFSSFSQFHEDLIIGKYLDFTKKIVYVDIGSNHPIKFNNTYRFYLKGGWGVNVEPNTQLFALYEKLRERDINLNVGVGDKISFLTFYKLWPDVSSTFSYSFAKEKINTGSKLLAKKKVRIVTLQDIFKKYIRKNYIDLISIDTEGFDLKVLKGNNWNLYRSKVVCIENLDYKVNDFLLRVGYRSVYRNLVNAIYIDSKNE